MTSLQGSESWKDYRGCSWTWKKSFLLNFVKVIWATFGNPVLYASFCNHISKVPFTKDYLIKKLPVAIQLIFSLWIKLLLLYAWHCYGRGQNVCDVWPFFIKRVGLLFNDLDECKWFNWQDYPIQGNKVNDWVLSIGEGIEPNLCSIAF